MIVVDASALLAYILDEPGADKVRAELVEEGGVMSAVNYAEVLSKLAEHGKSPRKIDAVVRGRVTADEIQFVPFAGDDVVPAAELRPLTIGIKGVSVSLADRACLALARRLSLPVLTGDRPWTKLRLGITVRKFRP